MSVFEIKPNRVEQKTGGKDEKYHSDYAEWAVNSCESQPSYRKWIQSITKNKRYYKNDQWIEKEDTEAFLRDESGNARNRIKVTLNQIRPMVEQYRGNGSILKINASAKSASKLSVNRRELALSMKVFNTKLAKEFPGLGELLKKKEAGIGDSEEQTTQIFTNLYVDLYVPQINSLLKYSADLNKLQSTQIRNAQNLALTGLCAFDSYNHGGERRYRIIEPEDIIFDTDARDQDLSDGSFMGYKRRIDASYLFERYQVDPAIANAIEEHAKTAGTMYADNSNRTITSNRPIIYTIYWRDTDRDEYGYVNDEYGYPYLTRINFTYPGESEPRYTDADLIDPPNTDRNKVLFKNGAKKRKAYFDEIRFCTYIPREYMGAVMKGKTTSDVGTLTLEYGILEYQEKELMSETNVRFPIKCQTWGYIDGEIFSPVDDAINPQRLINRVMSVFEGLVNNSGGSNVVIDEDSVDPNDDGIEYNIKEGNPIRVRTKGKGVPNTIGYYDNTPKQGVYSMLNVIPMMKQFTQDTTGINEAIKGESTGSDQLVGVTELMIQRGSLMQEPFYNSLTNLYVQVYQDMATVGKNFYIDHERELSIISGDEGAEILKLSKDLRNEDFRTFISRENDEAVLKGQANQMLELFKERGLIDERIYANLYNRSTPDDVTMALRSQIGIRMEAQRREAEQAQALAQEMQAKEEQEKASIAAERKQMHDDNVDLELSRQDMDLTKSLLAKTEV